MRLRVLSEIEDSPVPDFDPELLELGGLKMCKLSTIYIIMD